MSSATRVGKGWKRSRAAFGIACAMAILGAPAANGATPVLNPATQRYRADTPSSATGRSGNAKLQVRALVGGDGTTVLEASTGELDGTTTAPGNLSRMQVKLLSASGRPMQTLNENGLTGGGTYRRALPGLGRGQSLQVQANVRGIDGARTGVVTVRTTVLRRPDLAVSELALPSHSIVNTPVTISALVSELHGDVSTTSDCVLRVDGQEVDRAEAIWIAAGDSVSCAFTTTFPSTGTFAVTVEVANVQPGEDDATNNSVSGSVRIDPSARAFAHQATVSSNVRWTKSHSGGSYTRVIGNREEGADWTTVSENTQTSQMVTIRGQLTSAVSFPLTGFELSHAVDGVALPGTMLSQLPSSTESHRTTPNGVETTRCLWVVDPASNANLNVCARSGIGAGDTTFSWQRYGGKVVYLSNAFRNTWTTDLTTGVTTTTAWMNNNQNAPVSGAPIWAAGTEYRFDVTLTDGIAKFRVTPVVPLKTTHAQSHTPYACRVVPGSYYQEHCYGFDSTTTTVAGTFSATLP